MPDQMTGFLYRLLEHINMTWVLVWIMSIWAATVKYLLSLKNGKFNFREWMVENCVCTFVGVVTAMVCNYYLIDESIMYAIVALSAHNGTRSLFLIGNILKKKGL